MSSRRSYQRAVSSISHLQLKGHSAQWSVWTLLVSISPIALPLTLLSPEANSQTGQWTWKSGNGFVGAAGVRAALPTFNIFAGTYTTSQTVRVAETAAGATGYYSLDGFAHTYTHDNAIRKVVQPAEP
jgi:hypothetical protein